MDPEKSLTPYNQSSSVDRVEQTGAEKLTPKIAAEMLFARGFRLSASLAIQREP